MKKELKNFIKEVGTFTVALTLAFVIFLGIVVVRGAFGEPTGSPSDASSNAPSPINVNLGTQTKQGKIVAEDFFSLTAIAIDPGLGWMSQIVQRIKDVRETYHLEAAGANNLTVPFDLPTFYRLCGDSDGCRVVLGARNVYTTLPAGFGPDVIYLKGPYVMSVGSPFAGGLGRGWSLFAAGLPTSLVSINQGIDLNGTVQYPVGGPSVGILFGCQFTDGEFVLPSGGSSPSFIQSDALEGFGLRNAVVSTYSNSKICSLDIED